MLMGMRVLCFLGVNNAWWDSENAIDVESEKRKKHACAKARARRSKVEMERRAGQLVVRTFRL